MIKLKYDKHNSIITYLSNLYIFPHINVLIIGNAL